MRAPALDLTTAAAELASLAARRPDVIRSDQPRNLTPFAARLHRLAAFTTEHDLPEAQIGVSDCSVVIEVHEGLVENTVRRWAAALEQVVTEVPCDMHDGTAGTMWSASGWDGTGTWWMVSGRAPLAAVAR